MRNFFTERRLRILTRIKDSKDILNRFEEMVAEAQDAGGFWANLSELNKAGEGK